MGQSNSSSNQPSSRGGRGDRLRVALFFGSAPGQEMEFVIKFPEIAHASAYCDLVARRKQHITRTGRSVYMKLPDSVRRLERRESLGGFVFSFRSSGRAYEWEDDIFRLVDHRDKRPATEVVLKERWRPGELDHIFGVHPRSHHDHESVRPRSHHGEKGSPPPVKHSRPSSRHSHVKS